MRGFNLVGFIVGLIVAIIIVSVGPTIFAFRHDSLVYGLVALLVWVGFTLSGEGWYGRRGL